MPKPWLLPNSEPTPPHNQEAEEAILGSVLTRPVSFSEIRDQMGLNASDFYIERHQWIWEAFDTLTKQNTPIDYLTVSTELARRGHLEELGGDAYITSLLNQAPFSTHAEAYAREVIEQSLRRQILDGCSKITNLAYDPDITAQDLLGAITVSFPDIAAGSNSNIQTVEEAGIGFINSLSQENQAIPCHIVLEDAIGHQTIYGIPELTTNLGGIPLGYTTLVAGTTQTGKTSWGLQQAEIASYLGRRVLYISTESTGEELIRKRACGELGISSKLLRRGEADEVAIESLKDEANKYIQAHTGKLYFDGKSSTVAAAKASIAKVCPDLVILDHLGELSYTGESKTIGLGDNFAELRRYCKHQGNTALLVFHQIDIGVTDRPGLADLRWAKGDLSEKADVVLTMFRPDLADARADNANLQKSIMMRNKPVPFEWWIRKDRGGPVDVLCKAMFDLKKQLFITPTQSDIEQWWEK